MKRTLASFAILFLFAAITAKAEVVSASVPLSPANEVPPVTGLNATGGFQITVNVTRDAQGAITAGTVRFLGTFTFPGAVTVTGLHIHEGPVNDNGMVRFDSGITATSPRQFMTGSGLLDITVPATNIDALKRLIANPAGFYVNLHTSANMDGAIRGQIVRLVETIASSITMNPMNEAPPITDVTASGTATITINPKRDAATGVITGGDATFSMTYDMPANSTIRGLHIHEQVAGQNGDVVIDTGLNATTNSITLPTGKGSLPITVPLSGASLTAMQKLLQNPAGFYVNLHTVTHPNGLIRGQLAALGAPPVIQQAGAYFLPTGTQNANVPMLITGIDLLSTLLINGQPAAATPDLISGIVTLTVPAASLASPGTLWVQARNSNGLLSNLVGIVVSNNVNSQAATTTDAARFGQVVAPDSIAAVFGTNLATTSAASNVQPLPIQLDETKVFINGVQAGLFAVTPLQVNYQIPPGTASGPAQVVIVNKNGLVSRGTVNVASSVAGIFTSKSDGTGAPAAVASNDGQVFNIVMGNVDGSAVQIEAGNFVALFGTGFKFASTVAAMTIGGTTVTPLYVGPQGSLAGLDQINLQIPMSLAGRG
ncbi:MAG: CHRD domain-containing protein, partial [Blastocatellia bacterium]